MTRFVFALLAGVALTCAGSGGNAEAQNAQSRLGGSMSPLGTDILMDDAVLPVVTKGHRVGKVPTNWFWGLVSPRRTGEGAERWPYVLAVIDKARASGKPVYGSTAMTRRILRDYEAVLQREAKRRNVSLPFLVAVIAVESAGKIKARSHVGAQGLMQLMPATAHRFGVKNAYAPAQNIRAGAQYLDWLLRRFGDDAVLALAGYNAGEGAVDKYRGVPPYRETRAYVAKVAGAFAVASNLCTQPPRDARAPCILR
ncbi:MAG: lytic transglycosylase domain-containing protein [Paracoccaceae bacterium]